MRKIGTLAIAVAISFSSSLSSVFADADINSRTLGGSVKDSFGNPLSGVEVAAKRHDGKILARGTTGEGGEYSLGCLAPGRYVLVVAPNTAAFQPGQEEIILGANGLRADWTTSATTPPTFDSENPGPEPCTATMTKDEKTAAHYIAGTIVLGGVGTGSACLAEVFGLCTGKKRASPSQ